MSISFTINGKPYRSKYLYTSKHSQQNTNNKYYLLHIKVNADSVPIDTSLNTFLRSHANLRGTKFMCLEGGCGACIVSVNGIHPLSKKLTTWAINSVCNFFI